MLGTEWTKPGTGATVLELLSRAPSYIVSTMEYRRLRPFLGTKTRLVLTGTPLHAHDLERIQVEFDRLLGRGN